MRLDSCKNWSVETLVVIMESVIADIVKIHVKKTGIILIRIVMVCVYCK